MDFLKILRSFEELLYEAITWLFFYPRTLWRILWHPLRIINYTTAELHKKDDMLFKDTISPPIFLILTLILLYGFSIITHQQLDLNTMKHGGSIHHLVFDNLQNTLIYRSLVFSIWSLIFAIGALKLQGISIDRDTLRAPFFAQCFLVAPFAIGVSIGSMCMLLPTVSIKLLGLVILLVSWLWYLITEVRFLKMMTQCNTFIAVLHTFAYFFIGAAITYVTSYIILND